MKLVWVETDILLKDLKEYGRNPRRIKGLQFDNLVKSLKEDGYHQRLIVNVDGTIIGGHQRKKALLEAGFKPTDKIPVLMPNRLLTDEEYKRLNIRDNLPFGEFDFDILASDFEVSDLLNWGMSQEWLPVYEEAEDVVTPDQEPKLTTCPNCGHKF